MDDYWDAEDQWVDDARCIVCWANLGPSPVLVCSATCNDIFALKGNV